MKISIPLSAIYKSKYNEEYDTLQSFQENAWTNWNSPDHSDLQHTMNEYMQDEREQATNLIIKHLPDNLKHLTPSHLNDEPYKEEHIDQAFISAMDSAYMGSYIDEYTEKYKNLAFENLETLLDHLDIDTTKLSLYTEKSKYIKESTTKIKDLSDIDRPEIWEATHIQITLTKPQALKIVEDFNTYNELMTMRNTVDEISDYVYDVIIDELSSTYIDTENINRYGTLGDHDNTLEVLDGNLYEVIEQITATATTEAREQDATQALHDAIKHSTLFDSVSRYYLNQTDPLTISHNNTLYTVHVTKQ